MRECLPFGNQKDREEILSRWPTLVFTDAPETERWIEIRDLHGALITVIEVLSPTNKREDRWLDYRARQRDFFAAGVNLVEIDLIRGGRHVVALGADRFDMRAGTCHLICVTRPSSVSVRYEVYPCPLREPLPAFRVPLRDTDPDVPLALQPLIDRCYQSGRCWLIDQSHDPDPPVAECDLAWVDEKVRAAGLR